MSTFFFSLSLLNFWDCGKWMKSVRRRRRRRIDKRDAFGLTHHSLCYNQWHVPHEDKCQLLSQPLQTLCGPLLGFTLPLLTLSPPSINTTPHDHTLLRGVHLFLYSQPLLFPLFLHFLHIFFYIFTLWSLLSCYCIHKL